MHIIGILLVSGPAWYLVMLYVQKILVIKIIKISEELHVKTCVLNLGRFFVFMILKLYIYVFQNQILLQDLGQKLAVRWSWHHPPQRQVLSTHVCGFFGIYPEISFYTNSVSFSDWISECSRSQRNTVHTMVWPQAAAWACCTAVILSSNLFSTPNILFPWFSIFRSPLDNHLVLVKQSFNSFPEKIQTGANISEKIESLKISFFGAPGWLSG